MNDMRRRRTYNSQQLQSSNSDMNMKSSDIVFASSTSAVSENIPEGGSSLKELNEAR